MHDSKIDDERFRPLSLSLEENLEYLKDTLVNSEDIKSRELTYQGKRTVLLYIDTLVDQQIIQKDIIDPLLQNQDDDIENFISSPEIENDTNLKKGINFLLQGYCLLLIESENNFFAFFAPISYKRSITEPENEGVVRGPHYGLIEDMKVNLHLIRRLVESPNFCVHYLSVGRVTKTKVAIVYMEDIANPEIVDEVKKRFKSISSDTILSPGYIQEFTENNSFSPFPQHLSTERPDRIVANLMEGRVVILGEGDPTALIVPVTLFAFYQSPDDYNSRWMVGSFVRMIRVFSFFIALSLPSFYIATVGYHPDILPLELVFTIKSSLQKVPFPAIIEALLIEFIFELLREAGIRLPSRVGQTIGIVGGLVIGDAIVSAGLVSYSMVIVVSLTAIASFLVPSNDMSAAVRMLRFPLMIIASTFGYVGIAIGFMILFIHLCKLESFGAPYLAPFAPFRVKDMKDVIFRFPIWKLNGRPHDAHPKRYNQESISREWKKRGKPTK